MKTFPLLIKNAAQIVTITSSKDVSRLTGADMAKPEILSGNPAGYSLLVNDDGLIEKVGTSEDIDTYTKAAEIQKIISAAGKSIIPGFVDAHTHPVWDGDRVHEFAMKLAGATYLEIHEKGGGIHFTVDKTRSAPEDKLLKLLLERLKMMASFGTTTVEAKSGYGLDEKNELKMLRVLERAKQEQRIEISSTYCGAHAVPKGLTVDQATSDVIDRQIPALQREIKSGNLQVENIDVFCEKGVFSAEDSERILRSGMDLGLAVNFHGDELNYTGSAELAGSLNARAVSHLEHASPGGIKAMAAAGTVAVLLPTTAYLLRLEPPPARQMIDGGVAVALGTDFNPNAYCMSMPHVMNLACILFRMTMEEALVASTVNAAASIGRGETHGALAPGRAADFVILDASNWQNLIYQLANGHSLIEYVFKAGKEIYARKT